jgi:hypothetical protein
VAQRDYILRLIEQAVEFILRITVQRKEGRQDEAVQTAVHGIEQLFGLGAGDLGSLSADQLFYQLTLEEHPDTARDKCLVFAALVREAGLAYAEKNQPALAQPAFHLALVFTLRPLAAYSNSNLPPFTPDIDDLLARLKGFALPPETQELLDARGSPGSAA